MIRKVLVANRGEIALRVLIPLQRNRHPHGGRLLRGRSQLAARALCRRGHLHRPAAAAESYLNVPAVISAAEIADVDAIHPGYGLLSENANFAEVCRASNIKFIGPPPEVTRLMGEKSTARQTMKKAKVPILPGSDGVHRRRGRGAGVRPRHRLSCDAQGRGWRRRPRNAHRALRRGAARLFQRASGEAAGAFGNGDLYMENSSSGPATSSSSCSPTSTATLCAWASASAPSSAATRNSSKRPPPHGLA